MAEEKKSEKVVPVVDGPEHGYFGTVVDDTPNEDYTVAGVTKQERSDEVSRTKVVRRPGSKHSPSS